MKSALRSETQWKREITPSLRREKPAAATPAAPGSVAPPRIPPVQDLEQCCFLVLEWLHSGPPVDAFIRSFAPALLPKAVASGKWASVFAAWSEKNPEKVPAVLSAMASGKWALLWAPVKIS